MPSELTQSARRGRYGVAIVSLAAATVLRGVLGWLLGPTALPFVTYFPAVAVASWYGGLGPGLLTAGLSTLVAHFLFVEPAMSFAITSLTDAIGLVLYLLNFLIIVFLFHWSDRRQSRIAAAERESAEFRRWASDTLSSIGDGVICTDVDGCITFLNAVAERLTGWTAAEARNKPIGEVFVIINEYTRKPAENPIRRVLEEGTIIGLANHTLLVARDGHEIPIDDSGAPIRGPLDKRITGAVLVFRDMEERKTLEDELRRTASELEQTYRELAAFSYTIGHDLQEPLRNMTAFSQLLERHFEQNAVEDSQARDYLGFIISGSKRMNSMIRDLLSYSNAVNASTRVISEVPLQDAVSWAIQNLTERIRENDAEVHYEDLPVVTADHVQMVQLFQNLISNAIKYRRDERPDIHISATTSEKGWEIRVRDNGRGIAPADQKMIFDLFRRGSDADKASTGSGIGLAICKRIVERHGGRISVQSALGEGSTFHITIARRK